MMSQHAESRELKNQDGDIFKELDYIVGANSQQTTNTSFAKCKARQQLDVSEDSPFNRSQGNQEQELQMQRLRQEIALLLREETDEMRKQFEHIKDQLNELKRTTTDGDRASDREAHESTSQVNKDDELKLDSRHDESIAAHGSQITKLAKETKFRPLTGKVDCPNCDCDRRSSVCNLCINLTKRTLSKINDDGIMNNHDQGHSINRDSGQSFRWFTQEDNRPIRPTRIETEDYTNRASVIDERIVPARVFSISKSLDDKRTKLARAIDDLDRVMKQVKSKGERLEQDRRVAQLYKEQWKFGPSIGGPSASSSERLGNQQARGYQSRHDPQLSRDLNSLMGYQHVEPHLKLRQTSTPKGKPKFIAKGRPAPILNRPKSRSLESLDKVTHNKTLGKIPKSSRSNVTPESTINSNGKTGAIHDTIDAQKSDSDSSANNSVMELNIADDDRADDQQTNNIDSSVTKRNQTNREDDRPSRQEDQVSRKSASWFPVFGETEIKTVKRDPPKRKVAQLKPNAFENDKINSKSSSSFVKGKWIDENSQRPPSLPLRSPTRKSNLVNNDRVVRDAGKKLRFASDLLEQERQDSKTKNQLTVSRTKPTAMPRRSKDIGPVPEVTTPEKAYQSEDHRYAETEAKRRLDDEIARLEAIIEKQQDALSKVIESQDRYRQIVSPVTVRCVSPCSCQSQKRHSNMGQANKGSSSHNPITSHKALISTLKEQLNRSKLRLARALEASREKHQQLKSRMDSSLRKQSDLEAENQMLKQSLSQCIETCLKDVSQTFESLNETLNNSMAIDGEQQVRPQDGSSPGPRSGSLTDLSQASQLIAENRLLQQMKGQIESIEAQRRKLFEEVSKEKLRSTQLEIQLKEIQESKRKSPHGALMVERARELDPSSELSDTLDAGTSQDPIKQPTPSTSNQTNPHEKVNLDSLAETTDKTDNLDETLSSMEGYGRYLQAISPDLEFFVRQRKMILAECDDIKRMIAEANQ